MTRRWSVREPFDFDGLKFRIVPGVKPTGLGERGKDLRLEVYVGDAWRPVHMRLGAFLADFFYDNEEVLYPLFTPDDIKTHWMGGKKYLVYVSSAARHGWEMAEAQLQAERAQRNLFSPEEQ